MPFQILDRPLPGVVVLQPDAYADERGLFIESFRAVRFLELGLPAGVLIHEGGYNGKAGDLLQMYAFGVYPGLKGLCATGMTASPGFTRDCGPVQYPRMLRWLRD